MVNRPIRRQPKSRDAGRATKGASASAGGRKTADGEALPANAITIDFDPLVKFAKRVADLARKRAGALMAIVLIPYTFNQWNTYPVRVHDLTAPHILASCGESRYADGLYRRWGSTNPETTCPAAVTQTLAWTSFTNALASKCELEPRLTRLDRFLRDLNSTRPPAQPQREEPERIQTQVASYQEGMTP